MKYDTKIEFDLLHSTYTDSLVHSQYGSAGYTNRKICHKTYLQHSETSIAVAHKSSENVAAVNLRRLLARLTT